MIYQGRELNQDAIKNMNEKELRELSTFLREEIIDCVAKNGGHLSSNLGVVELTIGLAYNFNLDEDDIIFDVGHQTYAYKIITGRNLKNLRKKDGISPFSSTKESVYDVIDNGHSSTSLSYALALAEAKKLNNDNSYTIAFIGDGSITNGLSFEALNEIGIRKDLRLIIILNDNGMSISKTTGSVPNHLSNVRKSKFYLKRVLAFKKLSTKKGMKWIYKFFKKIKDFFKHMIVRENLFETIGIDYNGPFDGNNIKKVNLALSFAKKIDSPLLLHFSTEKGRGYELAQDDEVGHWHGIDPFDIKTGKIVAEKKLDFSIYASLIIAKMMEKDHKAFLICPAMVHGSSLEKCFELYPNRSRDVGIAEEHAIIFGAGLSLQDFHPIISIYSTFLQRTYDEIIHDLTRNKNGALVFIDRAGLIGSDGESHQGIYDVSFLKTIPNTTIYQPTSKEDMDYLLSIYDDIFQKKQTFFIRLSKDEVLPNCNAERRNNGKNLLITCGYRGNMLAQSCENCDTFLIKKLHPLDEEKLKFILNYEKIAVYDPYSTELGLSSSIEHYLINHAYKGEYIYSSIPVTYIGYKSIEEQLEEFGLDEEHMKEKLSKFFKK